MPNNKYKDKYYNHFSKNVSAVPPQFEKGSNYIMRFETPMTRYSYQENDLAIIYFKNGAGELVWKKKSEKINGNQLIITNPSDGWEYLNEEEKYIDVLSFVVCDELKKEFYHFTQSDAKKLLDTPFGKVDESNFFIEKPLNAEYYQSGKLLSEIHSTSEKDDFNYISAEELTLQVLKNIYKDQRKAYNAAGRIDVKKTSTSMETLNRLLVAREFIHDNIAENISIKELSAAACLSKFHLYQSFRSVFGKTPHQYANHIRLIKAKELLITKQLSISEVALSCGFNELPSFSRLFKKRYGVPPKSFKK